MKIIKTMINHYFYYPLSLRFVKIKKNNDKSLFLLSPLASLRENKKNVINFISINKIFININIIIF